MTTQDMLERMVARLDDSRLGKDGRENIEKCMTWLDNLAQTMHDHGYVDNLAGVIEDRKMLLDAVDGHRLFNRDGEELVGVEDSVRWNVTYCLINALEQIAGAAPGDAPEHPFMWTWTQEEGE